MGISCGSSSRKNVYVGGIKIGSLLPANITSKNNTVKLIFKTDKRYARSGWSISWRAFEPGDSNNAIETLPLFTFFQKDQSVLLQHPPPPASHADFRKH